MATALLPPLPQKGLHKELRKGHQGYEGPKEDFSKEKLEY